MQTNTDDTAIMVTTLAAVLEKTINKVLHYDPATQQALARFDHTRLAVKVTQPVLALCFTFTPEGVEVSAIHETDALDTSHYDAIATGSARDFINAANQSEHTMADSGITISGNISFLSQVQSIAKNIDIDWEDAITQAVGPVAGHGAAKVITSSFEALKRQGAFIQDNLNSVLRDELLLVPAQEEISAFCDEVDHIKEQTDRLEAKLHAFFNA